MSAGANKGASARGDLVQDTYLELESPMVRAVFYERPADTALELFHDGKIVYLLPAPARRDGLAGYEQDPETYEARPVEFTGTEVRRLLEAHVPREVPLGHTPAWVAEAAPGAEQVKVTWHARVRWADRFETTIDPRPAIVEAVEEGITVGIDRGRGYFHAPTGAVVATIETSPPTVTTVFELDRERHGADHLTECERCELLCLPTPTLDCNWCDSSE